jgi:hypothetical protein
MQNTTTQILYKYWNEVRGDRMAPRRFEIEPARFATILPETFMIECEPGQGYRFRLAGTRVTEKLGYELRGRDLSDLVQEQESSSLSPLLTSISEQGAVGVLRIEMVAGDGRTALFEVVILPLVHTDNHITRLLGAISTCNHEPWLGSDLLQPGHIVHRETVWPDGRPHAMIDRMDRQIPFRTDVPPSRLVRGNRRVFRVFDGGR